jgi:hypothetical protein
MQELRAHRRREGVLFWARAVEAAVRAVASVGERRGWLMTMQPTLQAGFEREHALARQACEERDYERALHHIGRAHILGSHFWSTHFKSHWLMLEIGWHKRDAYEVWIQTLRTAGTFGTRLLAPFFGTTGNPGSAQFGVGARFDLPADLEALLRLQRFTDWPLFRR